MPYQMPTSCDCSTAEARAPVSASTAATAIPKAIRLFISRPRRTIGKVEFVDPERAENKILRRHADAPGRGGQQFHAVGVLDHRGVAVDHGRHGLLDAIVEGPGPGLRLEADHFAFLAFPEFFAEGAVGL